MNGGKTDGKTFTVFHNTTKIRSSQDFVVGLVHRHTPPDYTPKKYGGTKLLTFSRRGSNHIAIARKIIATEKRKETYLVPLDPDDDSNENEDQVIASLIGRYKRRVKKTTENVCEGMFP